MSDARDRRVSPDVIRWSNPPFWARSIIGVVFAGVSLVMRAAARVYFSRLQVRHRARFPRHGPVLIVANHPAMWTDVIVLDVALGRKLHFLAQSQLFQPWLRGALLALHGALPVTPSHERPEAAALNAETFHTCEHLFARGEVVAMFPEGISLTDRRVLNLRPGAARIALNQALQEDATCLPVVIPVGLHYADRHAYGSVVTVSVGEPVDLAPFVRLARLDQDGAVRALTDTFHRALCSLTLDLPEPELAAAVTGLEPVAGLLGHPRRMGARERAARRGTTRSTAHGESPPLRRAAASLPSLSSGARSAPPERPRAALGSGRGAMASAHERVVGARVPRCTVRGPRDGHPRPGVGAGRMGRAQGRP
jgi:1-acyl-sn-glycerol-3-phosphate acyltransferase